MSSRKDKEAGKERRDADQGLGLSSNNVGIGKATRSGRFYGNVARTCCATTVPCSSNKNSKPEESSGAAKKTADGGVSESAPRKSGPKTVPSSVEVKQTASSLAKEVRGGQKIAPVSQTSRFRNQPDPPAKNTAAKIASNQQVWKGKAQLESTGKELSSNKQQFLPPGDISKQSTKTTNSSAATSKSKRSAIQREFKRQELLFREQFFRGKQKQAERKASTSRSDLEPGSYRPHIKWDVTGFDKVDNHVGVCCCLCEDDLGVAPYGSNNGNTDFTMRPVVAILPCGHSFHCICLNAGELEWQQGDPPCVFCDSLIA